MPWRNGVLVACAPDIFYAEDRDGDGKADHREVLFTGFVRGEPAAPAQRLRAGARRLGLRRQRRQRRARPLDEDRQDRLRSAAAISGFDPDTGEFEAESGQTQYGRHRDDWGHWFGNNNPNWAWHYRP